MLSDRQKKVIKMILNYNRGIYANEIAKKMQVSTRTIRNDIVAINLVLKNAQCQIRWSERYQYYHAGEYQPCQRMCKSDGFISS